MTLKHSKFRNTGIIFELLVRQIASDALSNKESKAVDILKRYFRKGELANEHKIYNILYTTKILNEGKAESLVSSALEVSKKLNKSILRREKYNLIKEIKNVYGLENFFKSKIDNYKVLASIYSLIESANSDKFINPSIVVTNKCVLLEYITKKKIDDKKMNNLILEEYSNIDKETRLLSYRILIEKFNSKYDNLNSNQKDVLKEYINNISNTNNLKEYINNKNILVKKELTKLSKKVKDQVVNIKLNEVISLIKPIEKTTNVKDEDIIGLLQYLQLAKELQAV